VRKLILKMSITLDGFVGGASGKIDWLFRTIDEEARRWIACTIGQAGVHIMGSRTYADMAAYWPSSTDILAAPMNHIPKVVFSRTKDLKCAFRPTRTRFRAPGQRSGGTRTRRSEATLCPGPDGA
jgi:dihydrofolate reductase